MSHTVELETRARRELIDLPKQAAARLIEALEDLQRDPRPPGAKKLSGVDGYRIHKGPYRILYTIDNKKALVRVYRMGHRRDIYRRLGS